MKFILTLFGIFHYILTFSQASFGHYNPSKYFDSGFNIIYFDSSLFLLGGSNCYDLINCNTLVKTDLNGKMLYEKIFTDYPYKKIGFDMILDIDSNLVITGTRGQTIEKNNIMVYKVNLNGDSIYVKFYDDQKINNEGGSKILQCKDSNYLIYAQRGINNQWARQFLIKTDRAGNKLWEKRIDGDTLGKYTIYQYCNNIFELGNGDFWMSYKIKPYVIGNDEYAGIIRTDSLGNRKVNVVFEEKLDHFGEISMYPYINEGVLVTWSANDSTTYGMKLTYFDSLGNEIWKKKYPYQYSIGKVQTLKNGNIIIYGDNYEGNVWRYIFCLDSTGNFIWQKTFPYDKSLPFVDYLEQMVELPDGRLAFIGDVRLPVNNEFDILLLLLDKNGCITPGCGDSIYLLPPVANSDLLAAQEMAFRFSPNPAKERIEVHFLQPLQQRSHELMLSTLDGQQILRHPLNPGQQDFTLDLSGGAVGSGTYILQYLREGHLVQAEKVVIAK